MEQNALIEDDNDSDYFAQFSRPDDSDDDLNYFYNDENDDLFINNHLNRKQLYLIDHFEEKNYQRSKRSNKKMNAQRQIKTKYAKSIKTKSHNEQLYMHHRLVKKVTLDDPSEHYMPSYSSNLSHSYEALRSIVYERHLDRCFSNRQHKIQQPMTHTNNSNGPHQFREYTIHEHNIPNEPSFDDDMVAFLIDMQNRDL